MAFHWRADNGQKLNAGLAAFWFFGGSGPVLQRNPIFCDFPGGSGTPAPPPPSGFSHVPERSIPEEPDIEKELFSKYLKNCWKNFPRC